MKKNTLIVSLLAIALVGVVALINKVSADATMTLQVTAGVVTCGTTPTSLDMGSTPTSTSDVHLTGETRVGDFACSDLKGAAWTTPLTFDLSGDLLDGAATSDTIPGAGITVTPGGVTVSAGGEATCVSEIVAGAGGNFGGAAITILNRTTAANAGTCDITYDSDNIAVDVTVPGYTSVDTYNGTIIIGDPV